GFSLSPKTAFEKLCLTRFVNCVVVLAFTVKVVHINLKDVLKQLSEPPYVSYVPMVRTVTSRGKSHLQFDGTALIQGQHMVGELNSQETQGLVWLLGKERGGSIEVKDPNSGDTYVLEAGKESMKTHVTMRGSELYVDTTIRIPGTIAQSEHANPMDPKQLAAMETLFTREVYSTTNHTLASLQSRKVDALGIGLRVYRRDPKTWHRIEKHWGEIFSKGHFTLHITVQARHPGLIRTIYPHVG
ncbi:Ger(x)C family spore germination C-terminal domain-containing protein, partial [Alicyclobacillus tolerans]|uniref:Ger(x)C family spore germination C-terminal domain-containing protein n=1 Tax=Alicyclobacillus tolerans TaxID=90970 RepID=UPI001F31D3D6